MTLASGVRLGPYEIVAPLGAGGMGEVYRAKDSRLGREVAVKVLPAELSNDPDRLHRFEQEARAASTLNHPNILTLFDIGTDGGAPYLVTELLEGETLRARLESGPLPARKAVELAVQAANGLAAAHAKGIVHRDLKPENLFVTRDGVLKILDFGLAKLTATDASSLAAASTVAGLTATGVVMGTPGYMAPEQVKGERVDHRVDLFALGGVLHEMLAARRPFGGATAPELLSAILRDDPAPIVGSDPLLPALERITRRCLEKRPDDRFQSARDLGFALEAVAGGSSPATITPQPAASRPFWRGVLRVLGIATVAFAAVVLLVPRHGKQNSELAWSGNLMVGGAVLAYSPRISPDGSTLAFLIVTDRQSQVAVMQPGAGRWSVLTHDRTRGPVLSLCWSRDGRLLYFHRAVSEAVYSVPALGGDERLVLENASRPEALGDGSLLVERISPSTRTVRLHRHWPDRGRTEPIGPEFVAISATSPGTGARAFADAREAVYFGILARGESDEKRPGLFAIDLASGAARRLAPELEFRNEFQIVEPAVAVDSVTGEVLVVVADGDLRRIVAIPRTGNKAPRTLLHLTATPWFIDSGADGALYVDQLAVSGHVLRFPAEGGVPLTVARFSGTPDNASSPTDLPGGDVLFSSISGGRSSLYRAAPGRDPVPFVESEEETSGPTTLLPGNRVAFLIGSSGEQELAIATLGGQVVKRFATPLGGHLNTLAPYAEDSLLFGAADRLFEISLATGAARPLADAVAGAVDARTRELLIRGPGERSHWIERRAQDGRKVAELGPLPELFDSPWNGRVVDRESRLLVTAGTADAWYVGPALVGADLRSLNVVPLDFEGDVFAPSWALDGTILATGWEYTTAIWRFRPATPAAVSSETARVQSAP